MSMGDPTLCDIPYTMLGLLSLEPHHYANRFISELLSRQDSIPSDVKE